jgi:hypothetical protein
LVEKHHRCLHPRILEIGIELRQVLRHHHSLVDDGARRQRWDVEHGIHTLQDLFGAPPRHVQPAIEHGLIDVRARIDEHLFDAGQGLERLQTAGRRIYAHGSESGDAHPLAFDLLPKHAARLLRLALVAIQEDESRGELRIERESRLSRHRPQETRRRLDQEATAVAGLAVGRYGAAMGEPVQGADGGLKNPVTRAVVEARDQTEPTGVLVVGGSIQAPIRGARIRPARIGPQAGIHSARGDWAARGNNRIWNLLIRHRRGPCITATLRSIRRVLAKTIP